MKMQAFGDSTTQVVNELKARCGSTEAKEKNWIFLNI
jgi:hypothetical protein